MLQDDPARWEFDVANVGFGREREPALTHDMDEPGRSGEWLLTESSLRPIPKHHSVCHARADLHDALRVDRIAKDDSAASRIGRNLSEAVAIDVRP